jgi:hypothetical protein
MWSLPISGLTLFSVHAGGGRTNWRARQSGSRDEAKMPAFGADSIERTLNVVVPPTLVGLKTPAQLAANAMGADAITDYRRELQIVRPSNQLGSRWLK